MKITLKPLEEQVILITGASSGIGLVTARRAAKRGAKVMLVARNGEALAEIANEIAAAGGEVDHAEADVGDREALAEAAAKAVERFGRINTWINDAGVVVYAKLTETPDDEHERLFRTNYFGVVNGSRIAVEHLREHGGALITVASIAADMPSPILGAYTASKHAVKAFIESLRIELQADGLPISISLIKPSGIATPMAMHAADHLDREAKIPPPAYDPVLVADAVLESAQRPIRELTIGGMGRAQALFAQHFPAAFERLAPRMMPYLSFPNIPKTPSDALSKPATDGMERSPYEKGFRRSAYTWTMRHPRLAQATLLGTIAAGGLSLLAYRAQNGHRAPRR
jgi:short-subunit dehydrogenase